MRNPSIGRNDAVQERAGALASLLERNLAQEFADYPFLHLHPDLEGTDASNYWWCKRNFRKLSRQIAVERKIPLDQVRRKLASRVAILECCPYRSLGFSSEFLQLPTVRLAKAALQEALKSADKTGDRAFVIPWDPYPWELSEYLDRPFVKNAREQAFTFAKDAKCGFGEIIERFAFDLNEAG